MQLFGGQDREPGLEVEPRLCTEDRESADACAVLTGFALFKNQTQQVMILLHDKIRYESR